MQLASDGTIKISAELDSAKAQSAMSKFEKMAKTGLKGVKTAVIAVSTTLAASAVYAIKTGMEFESAFAGVKKTVNATDEELQGMRDDIRNMAKDIPQSAAAISEVAEAAGQLGIKNDYIMEFTRTMSDLGVATNMSATEAATSLARLANITQMPQAQFSNLGSVVVALGNNLATTESEITEMGLRLAGAGKQVGMSEAQILGLAGALSSVGIEADAGGSAMSTVMSKIQLAVEKGGDSLEQFADVAGMSGEQFKQAFEEDAAGAIVSFITGLGTMESRGQSAIATLADMEITEIRQRDALLRLSGAGDVLSESLGIATQAWDDNNALTNEAEQRYETLESRLQILKNNIDDFGISVYDSLRDPLKNTVNESIVYIDNLHSAFNNAGLHGVVKELGNIFDDVTNKIADTSEAADGIITPLKNIATTGANLANAVLPVAADGVEFLAKNFSVLAPVITASATAIKFHGTITKSVSKLTKGYAAAVRLLNRMEKQNALQLVATNGGLTVQQTLIALYNGQIGIATALTGLWTKAQIALNTAMKSNAMGLVVTAAAALVAGLAAYAIVTDESKKKNYELTDSEKKLLESCNEVTDSLNEQRAAREESIQSIDMEYDGYQSLLSELQSITDENGKVKSGYEERAKVITGQLSDALGTEITLTDGVIQNYQETVDAIKEVIVQKKAEALCTALQEEMAEAYKNSREALLAYKDAVAVAEQKQKDLEEAQANYNEVSEMYAGNTGPKAMKAMQDAKQALDDAQSAFDEASESVDSTRTSLNELSAEVNNYDALVEAMQSGTTAEIESAMNSLLSGYQSYTAEMLASSQTARDEMLAQAQETTNALSVLVNEGGQMYQAFGEDSANAAAKAISEFQKLPGGIETAINEIGTDGAAAMVSALAQADFDGKLSEESKASYDAFLDGLSALPEGTQKALSDAVEGAMQGMEGFDEISQKAEEESISFLDALREALDEHSPSKATEEIFELAMEGAANGVDSGKENVLSKAGEFITAFLGKFTEGGIGETLQGIGANFMSFFGIGVSSQQENSKAAGKANADAANSGAGSVNPTVTGSRFGTLLGSGIGGVANALFQKGKEIANGAKTGTGSVDPSGTGEKFGSQYASGVSRKTSEANAKGKSLAINADSGAKSKDGYDAGSSFGSGFVNGIGSWISKTASKAAELANSALNAAKKALDSHSPSKKGRKLGRTLPQGVGLGIKDDTKQAVKASEDMSNQILDAANVSNLSEALKSIDVPDVMSRIYMSVDDRHNQVADKIISAVSAKENISSEYKERSEVTHISDEDLRKLEKIIARNPVVAVFNVDGRTISKSLAAPLEDEMNANKKLIKMMEGIK